MSEKIMPCDLWGDVHLPHCGGKVVYITTNAGPRKHCKIKRQRGLAGKRMVGWQRRGKRQKYIAYGPYVTPLPMSYKNCKHVDNEVDLEVQWQ